MRKTYVIDNAFSEEEENFIETYMYQRNWRFYKIDSKDVWDIVREDKKILESPVKKNEAKLKPNYTFAHYIVEKKIDKINILNNETYEKISSFIIKRLKEKVNFEEKEIATSRAWLYLPLREDMVDSTTGIHFDVYFDNYTCIYYVNDSDGDTVIFEQTESDYPVMARSHRRPEIAQVTDNRPAESLCYYQGTRMFKEHARITPKKGRILLFDGSRYHHGTQPRTNHRCLINFNLI